MGKVVSIVLPAGALSDDTERGASVPLLALYERGRKGTRYVKQDKKVERKTFGRSSEKKRKKNRISPSGSS